MILPLDPGSRRHEIGLKKKSDRATNIDCKAEDDCFLPFPLEVS
jgi:hypothetical protein